MNSGKTYRAVPRTIAGDFVADDERKGVLPVDQRAARYRVNVADEVAVNVNASTIGRVIRSDNVLQRCLQDFIVRWR